MNLNFLKHRCIKRVYDASVLLKEMDPLTDLHVAGDSPYDGTLLWTRLIGVGTAPDQISESGGQRWPEAGCRKVTGADHILCLPRAGTRKHGRDEPTATRVKSLRMP